MLKDRQNLRVSISRARCKSNKIVRVRFHLLPVGSRQILTLDFSEIFLHNFPHAIPASITVAQLMRKAKAL
jgi:hypothetical protein